MSKIGKILQQRKMGSFLSIFGAGLPLNTAAYNLAQGVQYTFTKHHNLVPRLQPSCSVAGISGAWE